MKGVRRWVRSASFLGVGLTLLTVVGVGCSPQSSEVACSGGTSSSPPPDECEDNPMVRN